MSRKVVLVIEDNADDEFLLRRAFTKVNIMDELVVAVDGEGALEFLDSEQALAERKPSLIVLDLNLPRLSGVEVLERIRSSEATRFTPVVMMSSSAREEQIAKMLESGANSFVPKPVDHGDFVDVVTQIGLYWLMLNKGLED